MPEAGIHTQDGKDDTTHAQAFLHNPFTTTSTIVGAVASAAAIPVVGTFVLSKLICNLQHACSPTKINIQSISREAGDARI